MYLNDLLPQKNKEIRIQKILSDVLKIDVKEKSDRKEKSSEETIEFLTEQMIKEVQKALR